MSATTDLLDSWKTAQGIESDYAAAKKLDVSRATISNWRAGGAMDTATIMLIAKDLRMDERAALAQVNLEKPLSTRDRAIWSRYCARVCVASMVTFALAATVSDRANATVKSVAEFPQAELCHISQLIHYAHLMVRRYVNGFAATVSALAHTLLRGTTLSKRPALA